MTHHHASIITPVEEGHGVLVAALKPGVFFAARGRRKRAEAKGASR